MASGELHLINIAVPADPNLQPFRQSIDHRRTHAMEAAGHLISAAAKLTASMEHREYNLQCRLSGLGLNAGGNTTTVILDGNDISPPEFLPGYDYNIQPSASSMALSTIS